MKLARTEHWRRERLHSAGYALGWRNFDYAGHEVIFHAGAVQGYRGAMALLPEQDLGVVILWNSESSLPSGLLPTIIDSALGLSGGQSGGLRRNLRRLRAPAASGAAAMTDSGKGRAAAKDRSIRLAR